MAVFLQERTGRAYAAVYREGDHLYSCYLDTPRNPMSKRFLAAYTPETLPPDIQGKGWSKSGMFSFLQWRRRSCFVPENRTNKAPL